MLRFRTVEDDTSGICGESANFVRCKRSVVVRHLFQLAIEGRSVTLADLFCADWSSHPAQHRVTIRFRSTLEAA